MFYIVAYMSINVSKICSWKIDFLEVRKIIFVYIIALVFAVTMLMPL